MGCQKCNSDRILSVCGKTRDLCSASFAGRDRDGYVPYDLGIGSGDYLEFRVCLDCGQMQAAFPVSEEAVNKAFPPLEPETDEEEIWERATRDLAAVHDPVDKLPFKNFKPVIRTFEGTYGPVS